MIHERKLTLIMDGLGFKESTKGTEYIRRAAAAVDEEPGAMITKDIYPRVSREANLDGYRVTPQQVERNIRQAVACAMRSPYWDTAWRGLGGWGRPSNDEVIRRLAREARIED